MTVLFYSIMLMQYFFYGVCFSMFAKVDIWLPKFCLKELGNFVICKLEHFVLGFLV